MSRFRDIEVLRTIVNGNDVTAVAGHSCAALLLPVWHGWATRGHDVLTTADDSGSAP